MLNSGKKINILTLVLSEKTFLNETKNHTPPPPLPQNETGSQRLARVVSERKR